MRIGVQKARQLGGNRKKTKRERRETGFGGGRTKKKMAAKINGHSAGKEDRKT